MLHCDDGLEPIELTDAEIAVMMWHEWQWNYDADRQRRNPMADPDCTICHGTGIVYDSVDYGSITVQMPSDCECCDFSFGDNYGASIEDDAEWIRTGC